MDVAIQPAPVTPAAPATTTIAQRVGQYVAVRDEIARIKERHKAELAPYEQALELLGGVLLSHLNSTGGQSFSSSMGTVYKTKKVSVTIADGKAFREWVVTQGAWDMADWRASKSGVEATVEAGGAVPPGVNYSTMYEVGVRRPSSKE